MSYADQVRMERMAAGLPYRVGDTKPAPQRRRRAIRTLLPPTDGDEAPFDCVYRGAAIGRSTCQGCVKKEPLSVFSCSVYGQCTYNKLSDDASIRGCCSICKHKLKPTDSTEVPAVLQVPIQGFAPKLDQVVVAVTAAPRREPVLNEVVRSIILSGFFDVTVFAEPETAKLADDLPIYRVDHATTLHPWGNYVKTANDMLASKPDATWIIIVQDDTILCGQNLRQWIEDQAPDEARVISLYTSAAYSGKHAGWSSRKQWTWGACAIMWRRDMLEAFLNHGEAKNWKSPKGIDACIGRWLRSTKTDMFYPTPSVAQHVGHASTIWNDAKKATGKRRASAFVGFGNLTKDLLAFQKIIAPPEPDMKQRFNPMTKASRGVTIITVTADEPQKFALLERCINRQTYPITRDNFQWIVVDQGRMPIRAGHGQKVVRQEFNANDGIPKLESGLMEALPHVAMDRVLVMMPDTWYGDDYVRRGADLLTRHDMIGETITRKYDLETRRWSEGSTMVPDGGTIGLRRLVCPQLENALYDEEEGWAARFWAHAFDKHLAASMTVEFGKTEGIEDQANGAKLREWMLSDAEWYLNLTDQVGRVVVYTAMVGDSLPPEPQPLDGKARYLCFMDRSDLVPPKPWERIPYQGTLEQVKLLMHQAFKFARWTIWVEPGKTLDRPPRDLVLDCLRGGEAYGYLSDEWLVRRFDPLRFGDDQEWFAKGTKPADVVEATMV